MSRIWIVVADASRARVFSADTPVGPITEIETLTNPLARLHEGDLVTDRSGRDSNRNGSSHGLGEQHSAKDDNAEQFASELCRHLEKRRNGLAFSRLYLVCAPAFLGMLRKHLSNALHGLIGDQVAKDLTTASPEQIRKLLPGRL